MLMMTLPEAEKRHILAALQVTKFARGATSLCWLSLASKRYRLDSRLRGNDAS